ncbi:MAG: hypothetical protein PWP64_808 [Candidatus Cloacimonadota bacterium]|nr:hypothetical protein [Candidatus Cloacimonadota bacterium]
MKLYTIGFSSKSAQQFFELLQQHKIKTLWDIRLNNKSQLAAFTKNPDLPYFLTQIAAIGYRHYPELAPDAELLNLWRAKQITWEAYQEDFSALMQKRDSNAFLKKQWRQSPKPICLLCSEVTPEYCHRALVALQIQQIYPKTEVIHL